jgi:hypothetical protein
VGERLGLQPFVLQREPDGGTELALQVGQRRGVGDDRDPAAVAKQGGDCAAGFGDRLSDRPAGGIHMAAGVGQPVGDLELGIADGPGEGRLHRPGRRSLAEAGGDPGDGPALDPGADRRPDQPRGEQDDRGAPKSEDHAEGRVGRIFQRPALQGDHVRDDRGREQDGWQGDRQEHTASRPRVP